MEQLVLMFGLLLSFAAAWDEEPLWDLTDISGAQLIALALSVAAVLLDLRSKAWSGAYASLDRLAAASSMMWAKSMGAYSVIIFLVLSAHLMAPAMAAHQDPSLAYASRVGRYGAWGVWGLLGASAVGALGISWARPNSRSALVGLWASFWVLGSLELLAYSNGAEGLSGPTRSALGYWGDPQGTYDWAESSSLPHPLLFEDELLFWVLLLSMATQSLLGVTLVVLFLSSDKNSSDAAFVAKVVEAYAQLLALALLGGSAACLRLRVGCPT